MDQVEISLIIIIFIIISFFILFGGGYISSFITKKRMKTYEKIKGYVTNKRYVNIDSGDSSGTSVIYTCEFEYLGEQHKIESSSFLDDHDTYSVGNEITIYIKKGNPNKYIDPAKIIMFDTYFSLSKNFLIILGVLLLFFFILFFILD